MARGLLRSAGKGRGRARQEEKREREEGTASESPGELQETACLPHAGPNSFCTRLAPDAAGTAGKCQRARKHADLTRHTVFRVARARRRSSEGKRSCWDTVL